MATIDRFLFSLVLMYLGCHGYCVLWPGQHECAQIINNYLTFGEVHEYSGGGATLPTSVATPLHSILISTNIHPVKLLLRMESHQCLVQEASLVCRSLQAISLRLINDQREGLALKAHYVAFLLDLMNKHGSGSIMKRYS